MSGSHALQEEVEQRPLGCKVFPLDNPMKFKNAQGILVLDAVFARLGAKTIPKGGPNALEGERKKK